MRHVWVALYEGCQARLRSDSGLDGVEVECRFGKRTVWEQPRTAAGVRARVCWVPGDDSTGDAGKPVPTVNPGQSPTRALATLAETFTIYVEAADVSTPAARASALAQYAAAHTLLEVWWRSFHYAAYEDEDARVGGRFQLLRIGWVRADQMNPQGATLRLLVAAPVQFPDAPLTPTLTDASAELGGSLTTDPAVDGSTIETQTIEAEA